MLNKYFIRDIIKIPSIERDIIKLLDFYRMYATFLLKEETRTDDKL